MDLEIKPQVTQSDETPRNMRFWDISRKPPPLRKLLLNGFFIEYIQTSNGQRVAVYEATEPPPCLVGPTTTDYLPTEPWGLQISSRRGFLGTFETLPAPLTFKLSTLQHLIWRGISLGHRA
jgi:hypothetical protein